MTDIEKMRIEKQRVADLLEDGVAGVEADDGDIRFFNAAFLVAAIQLQSEVEGPDSILRALSKIGIRTVKNASGVGQC